MKLALEDGTSWRATFAKNFEDGEDGSPVACATFEVRCNP
jgi:hypothetical protein